MNIHINNKGEDKISVNVESVPRPPEAVRKDITVNNKNSDHLYLERLEFNPGLRKSWLNFLELHLLRCVNHWYISLTKSLFLR